ncbi:uncharacterized protein LOC135690765 isoform X2 [Rhopilema esculentum]|uniref:uncharacterized protein LOC135690765 isoform X2 n=1 Tax=Rhopilema esculentum TaxID=499914 RepID=UPI0031E1D5A1
MKSPKVAPLELFPSVEVQLCDYEFKEKSSDNILDEILRECNKFGVCETSKVVFELKEYDDFDKFSKIKEEVQCRHAVGKKLPHFLLKENSSEDICIAKLGKSCHIWK